MSAQVVGSSLTAAEAYELEHRQRFDLSGRDGALARFSTNARGVGFLHLMMPNCAKFWRRASLKSSVACARPMSSTAVAKSGPAGDRSYLFNFEAPTPEQITEAHRQWPADHRRIGQNNEFRALVPLTAYLDRYLYVSREVDGQLLTLLDDTKETAQVLSAA